MTQQATSRLVDLFTVSTLLICAIAHAVAIWIAFIHSEFLSSAIVAVSLLSFAYLAGLFSHKDAIWRILNFVVYAGIVIVFLYQLAEYTYGQRLKDNIPHYSVIQYDYISEYSGKLIKDVRCISDLSNLDSSSVSEEFSLDTDNFRIRQVQRTTLSWRAEVFLGGTTESLTPCTQHEIAIRPGMPGTMPERYLVKLRALLEVSASFIFLTLPLLVAILITIFLITRRNTEPHSAWAEEIKRPVIIYSNAFNALLLVAFVTR